MCSVRLFQCTREVSRWVRWVCELNDVCFRYVNRPQKASSLSEENAQIFKDDHRARLLPHEASTDWEHQEGSEHHSQMWSLWHCRCVMWIRFMFHVLCFLHLHVIFTSWKLLKNHCMRYREIVFLFLLLGAKRSSLGAVWAFLLDFCSLFVIWGNEKPSCYKYRTSVFRYVKYAYGLYGTVLQHCRTAVLLHHWLRYRTSLWAWASPPEHATELSEGNQC